MWWAAIPLAISAISAITGSKAAGEAADRAESYVNQGADLQSKKLALAQWNLDDFKNNILPLRNKMLTEAMSAAPTAAYGREAGSFQRGMATAQENILGSDTTPSGLMDANLAGLGIAKAKGLATLRLQDDSRKLDEQGKLLSLGYQTPGAVSAMGQAYDGSTNFFGGLANSYNAQAAQGYAGVANALGGMAELYAKYGGK